MDALTLQSELLLGGIGIGFVFKHFIGPLGNNNTIVTQMLTVEFVWLLLVGLGFTKFLVHAQDQTDFISIDCGATGAYSDPTTELKYVPDETYIDTGVSKEIKSDYKTNSATQFWNVRIFPEGKKNCYDLTPLKIKDTKYLVRAQFMYGDYDSKNQLPKFDIYLGVDYWDTVIFPVTANASSIIPLEMIYTPSSNFIYVCLVNTGEGTPFISVLELRPLNLEDPAYSPPGNGTALQLSQRHDMGSAKAQYRYPDDIHDRIWTRFEDVNQDWTDLTTEKKISTDGNSFGPPEIIMNTAVSPTFSSNITISQRTNSPTDKYYFSFYFCDFQAMQLSQSREIQIYVNDTALGNPFKPPYLTVLTQQYPSVTSNGDWLNISIGTTSSSTATFRPILNAFEVYIIKELTQLETESGDVEAMKNIKTAYGLTKNWQGDPCLPQQYSWDGLICFNNSQGSPTVTSLNLSSSGLSGEIYSGISGLTSLENLDLSHNNLKGPIPDFLSQMTSLKVLNLKSNKLTGTIPAGLLNKSDQQTMSLSVGGNPDLCYPDACKKAKRKNNIVIALAVLSGFGLIIAVAIIFWRIRSIKRRKETTKIQLGYCTSSKKLKRRFKYSAVVKMTNNFTERVGEGGFGTVYRGRLDGIEVAVKKLYSPSAQRYTDFQSEAKILMAVNHKNLTSLVGYCEEGENFCLINEFMANGNLETYLSGPKSSNWEKRLSIALDTAHGLEYLHYQCDPQIIHRGIKPTNILLDANFDAKLVDFGLFRDFPTKIGNSVTVPGAGTPAYRDPAYERSGEPSTKIDVYAFGVVLLQIISGRPAIANNTHIIRLAEKEGHVEGILDRKIGDEYDRDSASKTFEVAMNCVSSIPARRPDMKDVVIELKKCLDMETAKMGGFETQITFEVEEPSFNQDTRERPKPI